jgi:hypothetical protein
LVGSLPVLAAPIPKELRQKATDQALIVGRWQRVRQASETWEFFPDGTAKLGHLQDGKPIHYTMDPKASPKAFGWKPSWGTWAGVYEVTADELRIAIVSGGGTVPTEAKPGNGYEYYEFRRLK